MSRTRGPLELILRAHGIAELVDAREKTVWSSDADEDFKEDFNDEFLTEEDADDVLDYLVDNDVISEDEYDKFDTEEWEINIESLKEGSDAVDEELDDEDDD
jgi:predicted dithiol-disulfide oxidoreductase (DUF899 family)